MFLNEETCVSLVFHLRKEENLFDAFPKPWALFLCVLYQANKRVYMDDIKIRSVYGIEQMPRKFDHMQPANQKI